MEEEIEKTAEVTFRVEGVPGRLKEGHLFLQAKITGFDADEIRGLFAEIAKQVIRQALNDQGINEDGSKQTFFDKFL